jgi:glycerol-1-phosphate dehydrogenase [NAD(P)+]
MNVWFAVLNDSLRAKGILSNPALAGLVPRQHYADDLSEFVGQLRSFAEATGVRERRIALFVDGTPKACSDKKGVTVDALFRDALSGAGFSVDMIVLSERLGISPTEFHASHTYVEKVREILRTSTYDFYLVLGSGSITDVVKHSLFLEGIGAPFLSVPTALTVTAFTSAFSIIDWHGAKRTRISRNISATFWIESILECAPPRMSRAGYGDLLARFLAYGDWYLGTCLHVMDRYDECALDLMEPFADGIKGGAGTFQNFPLPEETLRCISASLAMAGIAMSVSGETTPLSGFEHVISHGLDFVRYHSGRELVLHGEQVALACLTSAQTVDWLLGHETIDSRGWIDDPEGDGLRALNDLIDAAPIPSHPGEIEQARQGFIKDYTDKARRWKEELRRGSKDSFIGNWPEIKRRLEQITSRSAEIARLVASAGLPLLPGETTPPTSTEEYGWAVRFSPFVRSRMNMADLVFWMGKSLAQFAHHAADSRDKDSL